MSKGYATQDCPKAYMHTRCPEGYLAWHAWAEKKSKAHYQVECPGCGRYKIWKRKRWDWQPNPVKEDGY